MFFRDKCCSLVVGVIVKGVAMCWVSFIGGIIFVFVIQFLIKVFNERRNHNCYDGMLRFFPPNQKLSVYELAKIIRNDSSWEGGVPEDSLSEVCKQLYKERKLDRELTCKKTARCNVHGVVYFLPEERR